MAVLIPEIESYLDGLVCCRFKEINEKPLEVRKHGYHTLMKQ